MLGTILGDAFGGPLEGAMPSAAARAATRRAEAPARWGYTDDGAMFIAVAESLREVGTIEPSRLLDAMARRYECLTPRAQVGFLQGAPLGRGPPSETLGSAGLRSPASVSSTSRPSGTFRTLAQSRQCSALNPERAEEELLRLRGYVDSVGRRCWLDAIARESPGPGALVDLADALQDLTPGPV